MTNNRSVKQFKADMHNLVEQMKYGMHDRLLKMADELVENIQNAAPRDTGALAASARKADISTKTPGSANYSVLVKAGGAMTTRRTQGGVVYDYAIAAEFGTMKETPQPFFYNTVRLYRQGGLDQFRETFAETISENNKMREIRSQNLSFQTSVSHRGAVVSAPKR